jgi:hypothetical protein
MVRIIDPPQGWRYGFPKVFDCDENEDVNTWLINNGYPKQLIEQLGEHFHCRFWTQEQ